MSISTLSPVPRTFDEAIVELRTDVAGDVVTHSDPGYDAARSGFNLAIEQRPARIVVADTVDDVATAVRFARANGLRVAVQATGHGIGRAADGALLIVTSRLDRVTIDPVARIATVAAGAKWCKVLVPAQEHGLAPLLGSTTDVGAVGYTLGGGMGWLARRYGLASDSVVAFELVTPDGIVTRTTSTEQPELFWALKGGGAGTLGVVTGMEIELYPVSMVYAGNLLYPVEMAAEVVARWRDWVQDARAELTSGVVLMNFPPIEEVPEPLRGKSFVIVRGAWSGDLATGEALLDEWRTWRTPAIDMWGPMPFSDADTISNDPVDPMPSMMTTEWINDLTDEAIAELVHAAVPAPGEQPMLTFAEVRHAGGAVRANAANAVNGRARRDEFLTLFVGVVMSDHQRLALEAWLRQTRRRLAPFATGATYLNFTDGVEKTERTDSAFDGEQLRRLQAVKGALDAENRFAHGYAVRPG